MQMDCMMGMKRKTLAHCRARQKIGHNLCSVGVAFIFAKNSTPALKSHRSVP